MDSGINLGKMINQIRKEQQLTLKSVAQKLEIDLTMLSKIENGERQVQAHMIKPLSELFKIDYKELQIQYLNNKIANEFGEEPYFSESIKILSQSTQ
jgi:HTH-type transcriptional regulator, competence development regulator